VAIVLAIVVLGGALGVALFTTWYLRRRAAPGWPPELVARRAALGERLTALPARIAGATGLPIEEGDGEEAAVIAALATGRVGAALRAAEALVVDRPDDPRAYVLLARALLPSQEPIAAEAAARRAWALGARGAAVEHVLGLAGHRARIERAPRPTGTDSPYAALLTSYELFILELERRRRAGQHATDLWLAGLGHGTVPATDLHAAVIEHVAAYCDDLEHLLAAAEADPSQLEASYHAARIGVKLGVIEPARAVFEALAPRMGGRLEDAAFARDLAILRDRELPPVDQPPITSGTRSHKLKILR
jgi:hypothetical protein